jgi:galactokinase
VPSPGEHVDYHGYSVLPCALEHDVVIAVGTNGLVNSAVQCANTNTTKFPQGSFANDPSVPVDRSGPLQWWQYVQCGFKGTFDSAPAGQKSPVKGVVMVVDGKVPPAAGVSSSSALVVASTLAVAVANGVSVRLIFVHVHVCF